MARTEASRDHRDDGCGPPILALLLGLALIAAAVWGL